MPKKIDFEQLSLGLQRLLIDRRILSTNEICQNLKISQSTFSRLLENMRQYILVIGQARTTQYALKRTIDKIGTTIPLYEISESGSAKHMADLNSIEPKGFYLESHHPDLKSQVFEDLPYFLDDLRPSGFLGRLIPKSYPHLETPQDISRWNVNHCLLYLTQYGWDLIGNFILGTQAFQAYLNNRLNPTNVVSSKKRKTEYAILADKVLAQGQGGSSAAGEQPKFLAVRDKDIPVIVKFSPKVDDDSSRRWADLLICEHIANQILTRHKHLATKSQIIKGKHRFFLEKERFDRIGGDGRIGIISLTALDLEFVGQLGTWQASAEALFNKRIVDKEIYDEICWLEHFGDMIANSDRHSGNISFITQNLKVKKLAPVYDMLPMLYRPEHGQIIERNFNPLPPTPQVATIWQSAYLAAKDFWAAVVKNKLISKNFTQIAQENLKKLDSFKEFEEIFANH